MLGGEPLANRRKAREGMTFSDAVDKHLSSDLSEFRNEKHRKQWRSTLDTYAAPVLGRKMVSEITVQDMLRVLQPIWLEKTETASRWRKPRPMTRQPVRDSAQAQKSSKRREPTNPGAGWNPAKRGVPCDGLGKALDAPHDRRRRRLSRRAIAVVLATLGNGARGTSYHCCDDPRHSELARSTKD